MKTQTQTETDWTAKAATIANYVSNNLFEAHRGAMPWHQDDIVVLFGNDGYDERAKQSIAFVRQHLATMPNAPTELGFSLDEVDGYTWAALFHSHPDVDDEDTIDLLSDLVWHGWSRAHFKDGPHDASARLGGHQVETARRCVLDHDIKVRALTAADVVVCQVAGSDTLHWIWGSDLASCTVEQLAREMPVDSEQFVLAKFEVHDITQMADLQKLVTEVKNELQRED
ncbi:MAG: hypothetical protein GXY83_19940 [Rhodopirellula sp.]|nr:hypothetical protein [Rhodopirellula sp.]